jgi:hypothetical protein
MIQRLHFFWKFTLMRALFSYRFCYMLIYEVSLNCRDGLKLATSFSNLVKRLLTRKKTLTISLYPYLIIYIIILLFYLIGKYQKHLLPDKAEGVY